MPARAAKRRGNGEGTIFRRENLGVWCGVLTVDGKRQYVYAKTRQEVARKLAAAIDARDKGILVTSPQQLRIPVIPFTQSGVFVHRLSEAAERPTLGRTIP